MKLSSPELSYPALVRHIINDLTVVDLIPFLVNLRGAAENTRPGHARLPGGPARLVHVVPVTEGKLNPKRLVGVPDVPRKHGGVERRACSVHGVGKMRTVLCDVLCEVWIEGRLIKADR